MKLNNTFFTTLLFCSALFTGCSTTNSSNDGNGQCFSMIRETVTHGDKWQARRDSKRNWRNEATQQHGQGIGVWNRAIEKDRNCWVSGGRWPNRTWTCYTEARPCPR